MKDLSRIHALQKLASAVIWFEPSETALRDPVRFLVYAMTHATSRELAVLRKHVSNRTLKAALKAAPPGIMDKRSWAYWHAVLGSPPPSMPTRSLRRSSRVAQTRP
jgi:hypothetical protein